MYGHAAVSLVGWLYGVNRAGWSDRVPLPLGSCLYFLLPLRPLTFLVQYFLAANAYNMHIRGWVVPSPA